MKKYITICFAMILVVVFLGIVAAENITFASNVSNNELNTTILSNISSNETTELELPEAGSDTSIENLWDKLRLAFTFNREKRIQKALDIAEERLAEAEANAEKNPKRAEIARKRYEYFSQKAEDALAKLEENKNENNSSKFLRELSRIEKRFELHHQRAILSHKRILERMTEKNMSQERIQQIKAIFKRFEEKSTNMQKKMEQKKENLETKFKVKHELTDKEFDELKEKIKERQKERIKEIKMKLNQTQNKRQETNELNKLEKQSIGFKSKAQQSKR